MFLLYEPSSNESSKRCRTISFYCFTDFWFSLIDLDLDKIKTTEDFHRTKRFENVLFLPPETLFCWSRRWTCFNKSWMSVTIGPIRRNTLTWCSSMVTRSVMCCPLRCINLNEKMKKKISESRFPLLFQKSNCSKFRFDRHWTNDFRKLLKIDVRIEFQMWPIIVNRLVQSIDVTNGFLEIRIESNQRLKRKQIFFAIKKFSSK